MNHLAPIRPNFSTARAIEMHAENSKFWKETVWRLAVWNSIFIASFYFSKKAGFLASSMAAIDFAYRLLKLRPKAALPVEIGEPFPQVGVIRQIASLHFKVYQKYFPKSAIGFEPVSVSFDHFPELRLFPAFEDAYLSASHPVDSYSWANLGYDDEALTNALIYAKEPVFIDLSSNPITGACLHAGIGLPVESIVMQNLTQLIPHELRKLEVYPRLTKLDLSGSKIDNRAIILGLYPAFLFLEILRLDRCVEFTPDALVCFIFRQIQTLQFLTLIDSNVNVETIESIMDRASENRAKPLLIVWKEDNLLRADLSACSGVKKKQLDFLRLLEEPIDVLHFHEQNVDVVITWSNFGSGMASKVVVDGQGTFEKRIHDFLKTFEWIDELELLGFDPIDEEVAKNLSLFCSNVIR